MFPPVRGFLVLWILFIQKSTDCTEPYFTRMRVNSTHLASSPRSHHHFHQPFTIHPFDARQSLNDLLSDLVARPLGLAANSTLLEQLSSDRVKLPRKLHLLLNALIHHHYHSHHHHHHNQTERSSELNDLLMSGDLGSIKLRKSKKKKKNKVISPIGRCYEPYGCFRITEPFRTILRPINLIPEPPSSIKIAFYLRTRANPSLPERLVYPPNSEFLISKHFRPSAELKFIVHGYLENSDESWVNEMSAALLNRADLNVICVDWMMGATPPYPQAVANTRLVGAMIAHLIQLIQLTYPENYASHQIHIIGHSLGAHIAGYTGQLLGDLGRITGLDPAEPYFQYTEPAVRLDPSDARFVEVIHTDVASIMTGGFGMSQTCGHVDFYPNGGVNQPGCKETPIKSVLDSISRERTVFDGIRRFIGCNHLRSFLFYIEAINSECPFMGFPCASHEEFVSGQCTATLTSNPHYWQQCLDSRHSSTSENSTSTIEACPIRLGLASELDYRRHPNPVPPVDASSDSLVPLYFLQTGDRSPFCHYHYQVRLVIRLSSTRYSYRSFRTHYEPPGQWAPAGKLYLSVVGTRGRVVAETTLRQEELSHLTTPATGSSGGELVEHHLLASGLDLGPILRLELDWRATGGHTQRSLVTVQTKAIRRWLPGFEKLATLEPISNALLPTVLGELHRALNVSQSRYYHHHHQQQQQQWPNNGHHFAELAQGRAASEPALPLAKPPQVSPVAPVIGQSQDLLDPLPGGVLLEAITVTRLETGHRDIFCAMENDARSLLQHSSGLAKQAILLGPRVTQRSNVPIDQLVRQFCTQTEPNI